jgi:flagellar biosynthesis/type III secretory pathway ATPase
MTERFMAEGVRQHGQDTKLYWQETNEPRQAKLTTALHVSQEKTFITLAKEAAADRSDALTTDEVTRAIADTGLRYSQEQLKAIHQLGEGGRLGVMIGAAGVGKNVSLQPLVNAWTQGGRDVHGIALALELHF